jgi:hypothetical protein
MTANLVETWWITALQQLVDKLVARLLNSVDLLDVGQSICYRPEIQKFVNTWCVTTL